MRLIVRRGIVVDMLLGGVEDRRHWKTMLVMAAGRVDAERTDGFSPCLGLDEGHEGGIHVRLAGSLGCALTEETITNDFDVPCDVNIFDKEGGGAEWLKATRNERD
mmetsp:Transcript_19961/g.39533  ORF Transcript_19961/g.39533 Transcript_19961/m.39533 type:complete len:106 (+) Transcript_19961:539-856(+)